jgi:hypothetical protein
MKYSLRSLLSVVTVLAVLIGLWGENWRTCSARQREHAEQANQLEEQLNAIAALANVYTGSASPRPGQVQELVQQARDHRSLEAAYRQAIWQPWKRWWIHESRRAAAKANVNSN